MRFTCVGNFNRHVARHALQQGMYTCSQCDHTFSFKRQLVAHVTLFHPQRRMYECPDCPSLFCAPRERRQHRVRYHGLSDDSALSCPFPGCAYIAFTSMRLAEHVVLRHSKWKGAPVQESVEFMHK